MIKRLQIIRHGQTDYNKNRLVQGRKIDADLNEEGRKQAESLYFQYKDETYDKCYTSSLKRTYQTIQSIVEGSNIPVESLEGFDEMYYGNFEGQSIDHHQINGKTVLDISNDWESGNFDSHLDGGETLVDLKNRIKEAIDYVLAKDHEEKVLICMHSRAIRMLICVLFDYPFDKMKDFTPKNTGVTTIEYNTETKEVKMIEFNNIKHLQTENI